jgi:competence protein ComEC
LHVRFFAAGHGDAVLFRIPGKHNVLVDAGIGRRAWGDHLLKRRAFPYFKKHNIRTLDAFFLTHPHFDHFGDPVLLRKRTAFPVAYTNLDGARFLAHRKTQLERAATRPFKIATLWRGDTIRFGKLVFEVLHPPRSEQKKSAPSLWAQNNRSLVMRARYGKIAFLLTGDAGYAAERRLLKAFRAQRVDRKRRTRRKKTSRLRAQVLKLGHHGAGSTSARWLQAVKPRYAVATCCFRPQKKELKPALLRRLARRKIKVFRTDKHQDVEFITDGRKLRVKTHISFTHLGRRHRVWGRKKNLLPRSK